MRLIGSQTSTAGSIPSWMQKYGYVCGGYSGAHLSDVARYESVGETWSSLSPMIYSARQSGAVSDRGNASYIMCGDINGVNYVDDALKFVHATETWSDVSAAATPLRGLDRRSYFWVAGVAGYTAQGISTGVSNGTEKVEYPTETFSVVAMTPNYSRYDCYYWHHTGNNVGYSGGGSDGTSNQNDMDMFDLTTETTSYVANSSPTRREANAVIDDNVAAFIDGGSTLGQAISKVDYGSVTASTVSYTTFGITRSCALSFEGYGIFHGGYDSAAYENFVQKIDYTTYTSSYVNDWLNTGSAQTTTFGHKQAEAAPIWDV
jgi:hypothetical protein